MSQIVFEWIIAFGFSILLILLYLIARQITLIEQALRFELDSIRKILIDLRDAYTRTKTR